MALSDVALESLYGGLPFREKMEAMINDMVDTDIIMAVFDEEMSKLGSDILKAMD